jgi:histidinol dehydrogenase
VCAALAEQLPALRQPQLARSSLAARSALIVTRDLAEAFELANRYAAEHLQIMLEDAERWLERVEHAGAIFVGPHSPVPLGDYAAGPSHVLPTGGTARFFSVVGVEDFQKRSSLIRIGVHTMRRIGPAAQRLAELEGLEAHARAIAARLEGS